MTDNDNIATLEKPPNYVEFETWPGYEVAGPTSPILERRAQLLRDRNKGTAANAGTVINFYGDKMDAATTSAAAAPAPALSITPSSSAPLVEGPSGPHMPIKDFVTKYQLSSTLSDKLIENGYESTRAMSLIELPQLSEMEFKPGHIASLRVAIKDWQADA
uniref:Expressed protein n=2 Tax=Schizophyllum commune (strain H4-8 / FGSC 9210) TaxID=578458 RepID=D8Q3I3_SCHCM